MKVSVLIITYNQERYISEAIKSVLMQVHDYSWEIVLLDDHSTDNTFNLAKELIGTKDNVQLIKNEQNLGITKNYQKGFAACSGEYVFIVEGDDYWLDAQKIKNQVDFMENHPFHSMCFHPYTMQVDDTRVFKHKAAGDRGNDSFGINDLISNEGLIGNFTVCCYRKSCLDKLPASLFNEISYDWIINIFMADQGLLGKIEKVMSVYRLAGNAQWSRKPYVQQIQEMIDILPVYDSLLEGKYKDLFATKKNNLEKIIRSENGSLLRKLYYWTPAIIPRLLKLLLPPALKK